MLKHIPACLSPQLLQLMMEMGDGDDLYLAGANDPVYSLNPGPRIVRLDGCTVCDILPAILKFLPLSEGLNAPATVCRPDDPDAPEPAIFAEYLRIFSESEEASKLARGLDSLEKFSFSSRAARVYAAVITSDTTDFAGLILTKGRL